MSLQEVSTAAELAALGRRSEAALLLERAVEICAGSMGGDSALARAALHRLALVLYDDQRFSAAEAALTKGTSGANEASSLGLPDLLLLSKAQLFQGKVSAAVITGNRAVDLSQRDEDNTPDTEVVGQALRQLGAIQMLDGAEDDAETSFLRAARLGSTCADQGKGLAALASFNIARGDEQSVEEAVDLLKEACATTKQGSGVGDTQEEGQGLGEEPKEASVKGDWGGDGDEGRGEDAAASVAVRLARASVLCTAGQGELVLGRGTAIASERLGEALRIREELLPSNHPATAWTLGLLARCHFVAGEAVTAEGLFRAALDGLAGAAEESQNGGIVGGRRPGEAAIAVVIASPIHPYSKAATLRAYSELLTKWEKREAEGETVTRRAEAVESSLPLKPPGGLTMHMLHLDDVY
eukprot:jgi/Undpi1/7220/HiC_scaffold_22.g09693.m1